MLLLEPARGTSISLPLSDGDQGTAQTIALIRQFVDRGMKDPAVNRTALEILQGVPAHDEAAEVRAIYDWVRGHIRFTKDLYGKETLRPAAVTLEVRAGDCDDINGILLPALLGTVGYRTRLVTVASNPSAPDAFSHVYAEVCLRGQWIPLDAARPFAAFGKAPENFMRKRIWDLHANAYQDVQGLNGLGFDWNILSNVVPKLTQATAQIISAVRTPSYLLPTLQQQTLLTTATPGGTVTTQSQGSITGYSYVPGFGYVPNTTLLVGAVAVVGVIFLMRK